MAINLLSGGGHPVQLCTKGLQSEFFTYRGYESRPTYGIVPYFIKTEEYKRNAELQAEHVLEKVKEWAEIDAEDKARAEQKKKKGRKG